MVQLSPVSQTYRGGSGHHCSPRDRCFDHLNQQAEKCPCRPYRKYFQDNASNIRDRCRDRNPQDYRTDRHGCRYECGRPAQTQVTEQSPNKATIMAGQYKMSFDKADQSVTVQGRDGREQKYEWKVFGDPHVSKDGREIGTINNDVRIRMDDGTVIKLLMGDGKGGPPQPGKLAFVDTAAVRTPDGTGALVTGISAGSALGVTPLDSSFSADFIEGRALNKFGNYVPSQVSIGRDGNMVDQSSGQLVHDQYGLNRLDQDQARREAATSLYKQGYVPQQMADEYDQPPEDYDEGMELQAREQMSRMVQRLNHLRNRYPDFASIEMPMARYPQRSQYQPYGLAA